MPRFSFFCIASFLLSIAYGATFLLSLLVSSFGGSEKDAGQVFAMAMGSTLIAVLGSLGFALAPGLGALLLACGVVLGVGWGIFYTVGPTMVAAMIEPARRTHCFALLSGSMLTGIGSGPLLGKLAGISGFPVQVAFFLRSGSVPDGWPVLLAAG